MVHIRQFWDRSKPSVTVGQCTARSLKKFAWSHMFLCTTNKSCLFKALRSFPRKLFSGDTPFTALIWGKVKLLFSKVRFCLKDVLPALFLSEASGLLRSAGTCTLGRLSAVTQESWGSAMTRKTLHGVYVQRERKCKYINGFCITDNQMNLFCQYSTRQIMSIIAEGTFHLWQRRQQRWPRRIHLWKKWQEKAPKRESQPIPKREGH